MINLLPPKIRRQRRLARIFRQLGRVSVILLMLSVVYAGGVWVAINQSKVRNLAKLNELDELRRAIVSQSTIEQKIDLVNNRLDLTRGLRDGSKWRDYLADLAINTPDTIKISDLTLTDTAMFFEIVGQGTSRRAVVEYQGLLEQSLKFKNVELVSMTENSPTNDIIDFVLKGAKEN